MNMTLEQDETPIDLPEELADMDKLADDVRKIAEKVCSNPNEADFVITAFDAKCIVGYYTGKARRIMQIENDIKEWKEAKENHRLFILKMAHGPMMVDATDRLDNAEKQLLEFLK